MTGEIAAGEIYSAPALAAVLGVSATPVREALLDLSADGLVEGDTVGFLAADRDFHLGLLATLGNSRLVDIWAGIAETADP